MDLTTTTALGPVQRARALERLADRLTGGVLTITAQEERSQLRNREAAEERLKGILAEALAPPPRARRPTKPGKRAVDRRITAKKRRGKIKEPVASTRVTQLLRVVEASFDRVPHQLIAAPLVLLSERSQASSNASPSAGRRGTAHLPGGMAQIGLGGSGTGPSGCAD